MVPVDKVNSAPPKVKVPVLLKIMEALPVLPLWVTSPVIVACPVEIVTCCVVPAAPPLVKARVPAVKIPVATAIVFE